MVWVLYSTSKTVVVLTLLLWHLPALVVMLLLCLWHCCCGIDTADVVLITAVVLLLLLRPWHCCSGIGAAGVSLPLLLLLCSCCCCCCGKLLCCCCCCGNNATSVVLLLLWHLCWYYYFNIAALAFALLWIWSLAMENGAIAVVLELPLWHWSCCCGLEAAAVDFVLLCHCCGILLLLYWHCCDSEGIYADGFCLLFELCHVVALVLLLSWHGCSVCAVRLVLEWALVLLHHGIIVASGVCATSIVAVTCNIGMLHCFGVPA